MGQDVFFSCDCGQIMGRMVDTSPRTGTACICHCRFCRAAEVYLDQTDPGWDGVGVFQTSTDRVRIDEGLDHLKAFSFSKDGLVRWYAGCCKVPMFNTMRNPRWALISVSVDRIPDPSPLGEIKVVAHEPDERGKLHHTGLRHAIWGVLSRAARMQVGSKWKNFPLYGKSQRPIVAVHVLSDIEKKQLPLARPEDQMMG